MSPLVSVLIPAFNAATTIAETLRSAQRQTYRDLEIIVVDDGSRDETARIVAGFLREDSRIRLIRQPNSGVAAARNAALEHSNGSLIAPLDADDLWHPRKIELQVNSLVANRSDAGLDYCWFVDIDRQSKITRCYESRFEGDVYEALILSNFVGNSSVPLIRRPILESVGGWDTGLRAANAQGCEDWLLYLKIAERSRVVLTPAFLVGYRQLPGAMSRNLLQMSRSYKMTMARVRLARPQIAKSVFLKSGVDFDLYISGMCWATSRPIAGTWFMLHSIVRDPLNWRHELDVLRDIARWFLRRGNPDLAGPSTRAIKGLAFNSLQPDARCGFRDTGN